MENNTIKAKAWEVVSSCWPKVILATVVVFAVNMASYLLGQFTPLSQGMRLSLVSFLGLVIVGPLVTFSFPPAVKALLTDGDDNVLENMFSRFWGQYFRIFKANFLMSVLLAFWFLLLFVPGIIKSLAYSMTPFIMADDPEISALGAIKKSNEMMKGHKMELFLLVLSFIGWFLLMIVSFGIAGFWATPYFKTSEALFYENLKNNSETIG